jgi:hypothetical protein
MLKAITFYRYDFLNIYLKSQTVKIIKIVQAYV